jgi:hypothetical protein
MVHRTLGAFALVSLCHCGSSAVSPADTGADVGRDAVVTDDGARLDSPAPVDRLAAVMCAGGGAVSFPTFDRRCAGDGDCFAAAHQTDCCGNVRVLGLSVSERAPFEEAERTCRGQYPGCGCSARPPTDDDDQGSTAGEFGARCASGTCRSFAR